MSSLLLPERHPVKDFFVLDAMDVLPRADMASMEHPIFSLSTKPDSRSLKYQHGENSLEIIPSSLGLPTVFDKDVLIYCISKLMSMKDKGQEIGPSVRITTHDLLVNTNRPTNNLGYERLAPALDRLRGVVIKTNVRTGDQITTRGFGLIEEYEYNRKGSMFADRLRYLEVRISNWMFRAIEAAEVLPISRQYFRLRRPLDRRLYELARKHCGQQPSWRVGFDVLQKKSGSGSPRKLFTHYVRETVSENHLPGYTMTVEGEQVVFWRREETDKAQKLHMPSPAPAADVAPSEEGPRRILISADALERARGLAPGWDKYYLEAAYREFFENKDGAKNEDARFLSWVPKFVKGRKP
jgi:plasmid replication initiation protein